MPDQQDQPTDLGYFVPGAAQPAPDQQTPQPSSEADATKQLQAMFGPSGSQVPLEKNDSGTAMGVGLKTLMNPSPIDPPNLSNFNYLLTHPYQPKMVDGRLARDANGVVQNQEMLDAEGNIVKDAQGRTMYEKNPFYASPAHRLLQGFLSNAMTLGMPAVSGHPDVVREQKKAEWETAQQQALQTAYKNASTNVAYARIQATNARQQFSLEYKRNHDTMTNAQFEQRYQISRQRADLADKVAKDAEDARTKRLTNQTLTREENLLNRAYGPAAGQAVSEWLQNNPGKEEQDALLDPRVRARAAELYNIQKPIEAGNMAIEKMINAGELVGVDMKNPAAIYEAAQRSKTLTGQEKADLSLSQIPQLQKFGAQQANIALQNEGRANQARIIGQNKGLGEWVIQDENGVAHTLQTKAGDTLPQGAMTPTQFGSQNIVPTAERSQGAQAGMVVENGNRLIEAINANKDRFGNWDAIRKSYVNDTPFADPFISQIEAALGSYAALNPKMHGFRGQNAFLQFEKLIGHPMKNADALIAAIQGINGTADIIKSFGTPFTSPILPQNPGGKGKGQPIRIDRQRDPKNPGQFIDIPVYK